MSRDPDDHVPTSHHAYDPLANSALPRLPTPPGETVTVAGMFTFASIPTTGQIRDADWLHTHAASTAYALRFDHLPHVEASEDEGVYEFAVMLTVPVESVQAYEAMRTTARLS